MTEVPVIAVDGPSGTGKGTVCGHLAKWLSWHLLDSGALYRVLALAALEQQLDLEDEAALAALADGLPVSFRREPGDDDMRAFLDGREVSSQIRNEACGNAASRIASRQAVRSALVELQRGFRRPPGLVADGRDMGTIIFPDAGLKIFLTASAGERARRRYKQLIEQGISVNLTSLSAEIAERDERDVNRSTAPLRPAADAVTVDTTELAISEVIARIEALVREHYPEVPKHDI